MLFGKGTIEIIIPAFDFNPGDIISGSVVLSLEKPVKAREVSVSLIGEQTIIREEAFEDEALEDTKTIHEFKLVLDGEKEYTDESKYNFEVKIPLDILNDLQQDPQEGLLEKGLRAIQAYSGMNVYTDWYLSAKLDIPIGIDITKKEPIKIN